jgi:hypothetical protein
MLLTLLLNNLLSEVGEPPSWVVAGYSGGTAVSADGTMGTIYLGDASPVPETAFFIAGIAHHSDGRRYVCDISGRAIRDDGAMCIVTSGTPAAYVAGWPMSARGEVRVSTSTPDCWHNGLGFLQSGALCVSAIS